MRGVKTLLAGIIGFVIGSIGWAAVSGVLGGVLDSFGIVIAGSTYLAASPRVGALTAAYLVREVRG